MLIKAIILWSPMVTKLYSIKNLCKMNLKKIPFAKQYMSRTGWTATSIGASGERKMLHWQKSQENPHYCQWRRHGLVSRVVVDPFKEEVEEYFYLYILNDSHERIWQKFKMLRWQKSQENPNTINGVEMAISQLWS